eukprot:8729098-Pyramimonas_sp.AAC.1
MAHQLVGLDSPRTLGGWMSMACHSICRVSLRGPPAWHHIACQLPPDVIRFAAGCLRMPLAIFSDGLAE